MVTIPTYFTRTMNKEIDVLTDSTLIAIEHNLNSYFDELERITIMPYFNQSFMDSLLVINNNYYRELDTYNKFLLTQSIQYTLANYLQSTRVDVLSALFVTENLQSFITTKKYGQTSVIKEYNFKEADWYQEAVKSNSKVTYINAHKQDYLQTPVASQVFSVARLIKDPITLKTLGVLMADMDTNIIAKTFNNINLGVSSIITVYDGNNNLIYTTKPISKTLEDQIINYEGKKISSPKDDYRLITRPLSKLPWHINILVSQSELNNKIKGMYVVGGLFIFLELLITILIYYLMWNHITKPFNNMLTTIEKIQKGNRSLLFDESGKDEIAYLCHNLNDMMYEIDDLVSREYKAIIEKQKAEYHALQSQIQPHFLFNTLNGLIGLNRLGERKKVEETIINLTGMMRYILNQQDTSSLEEEFRLLERYCSLQKVRFGERINYRLELQSELRDIQVPKLLLQPLVENAIIHGLEPMQESGKLQVKAFIIKVDDKEHMYIIVEDNGVGFDINKISSNVGITNIKNRLILINSLSQIIIHSKEGEGTKITIKIPLNLQNNQKSGGVLIYENLNS
ncbi:sensor histidine kinase [Vallitalea sediminicola]